MLLALLRAEPMTTYIAGIDTSHSTRFTVLLVSHELSIMKYVDKPGYSSNGKIVPADLLLLAAR